MDEPRTLLLAALRRHADGVPADPNDEDMRLDGDWWLTGTGLLDVARELEEHLTSPLDAEDLLDMALASPTMGALLTLVRHRWAGEGADAR